MKYILLPNTDIEVSKICLGTMTFGEQNSEKEAHQQLDYAIDQGVNFIDCAEMYPVPGDKETQGKTEEFIGSWLKKSGNRSKVSIATKVTGPSGMTWIRENPHLDRKSIRHAIEGNLKRLQTDCVELYQLHWPDRNSNFFGKLDYVHNSDEYITPLLESLEAMNELVQEGKIKNIGISNETAWGAMKYLALAKEHNLRAPITIQNPYCLLNRTFEIGLGEVAHRENMGLLAYSPLGFGVLSGKYLNNNCPENSRKDLFGDKLGRYYNQRSERATEKYVKLAIRHELDPAQAALAWVNQRPFLTSNIIGATNMEQLKANIDSIHTHLPKEYLDGVENIHSQNPNPAP